MTTVALIGPDGAGKSSIINQLKVSLSRPVRCIYMGIRLESSYTTLPTTKLILRRRHARLKRAGRAMVQDNPHAGNAPPGLMQRAKAKLRSIVLLLNLVAEEWYRQELAWSYQRQGMLVLFERHFIADHFAFSRAGMLDSNALGTRVHAFLLKHVYPEPDVVILLDAPIEVLFSRKGECSRQRLARLRDGYLAYVASFENSAVIDATQSIESIAAQVEDIIQPFLEPELAP